MQIVTDTDKELHALDVSLPPPNKNVGEIKTEKKEGPIQETGGGNPKVEESKGTGPGFGHGQHPQFSNGALEGQSRVQVRATLKATTLRLENGTQWGPTEGNSYSNQNVQGPMTGVCVGNGFPGYQTG